VALSVDYKPRKPKETALYRLVHDHLAEFIDHADRHDCPVPGFVRRSLQAFLACGDLEHGFARAVCGHCGTDRLVPFSCKGRALCPSCVGRRMNDTAARLVDQVIPHVPVRQWVLSLPHALRYILAYNTELCGEVLGIFVAEVYAWLRRAARRDCDIGSDSDATLHCGSVSVIQRADSACKLNLHFHCAALDGAYVVTDQDPRPRFVATPAPSAGDIAAVAWSVCLRTMDVLKRRGVAMDMTPEEIAEELHATNTQADLFADPLLAQCASASMQDVVLLGPRAGRRVLRLGAGPLAKDSRGRAAHGFDLHAGRRVSATARKDLERLFRYMMRPPLSHDRLTRLDDGRVRLRLKRPWQDGTTHLVFDAIDFLARLVPLVPPPKMHQVRYHGILSSHAILRSAIVPDPPPVEPPADAPEQLGLFELRAGRGDNRPTRRAGGGSSAHPTQQRIPWARLMKRVFNVDPLRCPKCLEAMTIVAFVTDPATIAAILRQRGMHQDPLVPSCPPRGPPQLHLPLTWGGAQASSAPTPAVA